MDEFELIAKKTKIIKSCLIMTEKESTDCPEGDFGFDYNNPGFGLSNNLNTTKIENWDKIEKIIFIFN